MQIDRVEGLEELLQSLSIDEGPGKVRHIVYPWSEYSKVPGQDVGFWYTSVRCQYSTLRRLVLQEFKSIGHPCSERLADGFVLAFTLMPKTRDAVTEFKRSLGSFVAADFSQFLLIPASAILRIVRVGQPPEDDLIGLFEHGPFRYEPLDRDLIEPLKYRLERTGEDSLLRDEKFKELLGCIAICRNPKSTKVIDFTGLGFKGRQSPEVVNLMQYYFDDLSAALFEDFWREHMESQYLSVAAGASLLDRSSLESMPGTAWLSVFWGFDLLSVKGMYSFIKETSHYGSTLAAEVHNFGVDLAEAKSRIELELTKRLGPGPHGVYPSLQNFMRIVARSRELQNRGYIEESFTLLMVAMESLLAERDSISSAVSRRAGALLAIAEEKPFRDYVRTVSGLYDARSKFVHDGEAITPDSLAELREVCRTVFFAAYRSRASFTELGESDWKSKWFAILDYISACFDAGITVDSGAVTTSGALKSQRPIVDPEVGRIKVGKVFGGQAR